MELWEIMLIAGGSRDMETFETVLDTLFFIEDDHGHPQPNSGAGMPAETPASIDENEV